MQEVSTVKDVSVNKRVTQGRRASTTIARETSGGDATLTTATTVSEWVRSGSQTEAALDMIRSRIIDMTLEPGSRIDEPLLIKTFKLGRTPAREAINRLVAEGFVRILPQRGGTYVRKLDFDEMGEVIVAHQVVESIVAELCQLNDPSLVSDLTAIQRRYIDAVKQREYLAITQLNQDFHLRLHRTVGNALFYDFAKSTHLHLRRLNVYVYLREAADPEFQSEQFASNLDQHDRIIQAVEKRDRNTLTDLLPDHAKYTQRRLMRLIEAKSIGRLGPHLANLRTEATTPDNGPINREVTVRVPGGGLGPEADRNRYRKS